MHYFTSLNCAAFKLFKNEFIKFKNEFISSIFSDSLTINNFMVYSDYPDPEISS